MTRAEKLNLHAVKATMELTTPNMGKGPEQLYIVSMSLTPGQLIALSNALSEHETPVGEDVMCFLRNAASRAGIEL